MAARRGVIAGESATSCPVISSVNSDVKPGDTADTTETQLRNSRDRDTAETAETQQRQQRHS